MHETITPWLGHEFVALSAGGDPRGSVTAEMVGLLGRMDERLRTHGLSLADTVRTRLWARDMDAWGEAVEEPARILSGDARSVSSSHIWPSRFASPARLSLELLAMRPDDRRSCKQVVEYEPGTIVARHLVREGVLFISGNTVVLPALEQQLPVIAGRIGDTLAMAGSSWQRAVRASFFLHELQRMEHLRQSFRQLVLHPVSGCEYAWVDTRQGKPIEIEVTAEV